MNNERLKKLSEMLKEQPDDSFLLFAVAKEYIRLNETEKALDAYRKIIETNPGYTGTYLHLGKLYEQMGDTVNAETIYRQGINVCEKLYAQHDMNELKSALGFLID